MNAESDHIESRTDLIPFNRPFFSGRELENIAEAHARGALSGNGLFSKKCESWLENATGCNRAFVTHSCTAALEMTALLLDLQPGDEVIMPSYTFVSTANAFALRGARPVFVDIRPDTLNIDETKIEAAITDRTRAICVVHYAGVGCEMDAIMAIAARHRIDVIEDAAQAIVATYKGRALGSIGRFGALSFHETKNATCGEGGALLINDADYIQRAEIMREKGTDRSLFMSGLVDKYTWRSIGSSFLLGEMASAFLLAQLEGVQDVTRTRLQIWAAYHEQTAPLEALGLLRRPTIPAGCEHNAHMYYVLLDPAFEREPVLRAMAADNVNAVFHYIPLHSSEAGRRLGRAHGDLSVTDRISAGIVRLPLWPGMTEAQIARVVESLQRGLEGARGAATQPRAAHDGRR